MTLPELNKDEWETAMATLLASVDISEGDKWSVRGPVAPAKGPSLMEIPDNHPPKTTSDTGPDSEIPAGGGFEVKVGKPESGKGTFQTNIPSGSTSPVSKPDVFSVKVGKAEPTGKPSGTMAAVESSGDVWNVRGPITATGSVKWDAFPPGATSATGPSADPTKTDALTRVPRTSLAGLETSDPHAALPDGSFLLETPDDVHAAVAKVQNAEQTNPRQHSGHPWYQDIKNHVARRAQDLGCSNMVPDDWQLSMAMHADEELAKAYTTEARKTMAKGGTARKDGSYPIANLSDLSNAMQAWGRSAPAERASVKAWISKRARELKAGPAIMARISHLGAGDSAKS